MALIDRDYDDEELLRAEDEAIAEAKRGEQPEHAIPTGDTLALLIEELAHGATTPVHQG